MIAVVLNIGFSATRVDAQTLFSIPDTTPNYQSYAHLEECVAAIDRLHTEWTNKEVGWRDTTELDVMFDRRMLQPYMVETAQRCMARARVDTLPIRNAKFWMAAFLMANRDSDAEQISKRLLDSIPLGRRRAFIDAASVYLQARPVRYPALRTLFQRGLKEIPLDSMAARMSLRSWMVEAALLAGDSAYAREVTNEAIAITETLKWSTVGEKDVPWIRAMMFSMLYWMTKDQYLDSLTVSTTAARSHVGSLRFRAYGDSAGGLSAMVVGMPSPKIEGEFWYRSRSSTATASSSPIVERYEPASPEPRPVPGRVNLLVFLQGGCHTLSAKAPGQYTREGNNNRSCWRMVSALQRFKRAYPDLEITVVSKTYGSLGDAPPLTPEREADTLAKYFLGFHQIPGTLVVSNTKNFRLSEPDRRRIDEETRNDANFLEFLPRYQAMAGVVIAVDETGRIFHEGTLQSWTWNSEFLREDDEQGLKKVIAAVYRRIGKTAAKQ